MILNQEEVFWFQKLRTQWLEQGDKNTKYYHTVTKVKRKFNRVEALMDSEGQWIYDNKALKNIAFDFYQKLFEEELMVACGQYHHSFTNEIPDQYVGSLNREVTKEEVYQALQEMGPYKAPGPDGFQPFFFQKNWDMVGKELASFVQGIYAGTENIASVNKTLLVFIPKISKPEVISQFRPIKLCNTVYKVVSKTLVHKIKEILPQVISKNQSSFVPGRHIINNIVVAQEIIHSMRYQKGKKAFMALKIDLEKAYDRLRWSFIRETLELVGFPTLWLLL